MIDTVLFDLDGTLLPMDQDAFIGKYMELLAAYMEPCGYEPKKLVRVIWEGTAAMVRNTGEKTNEQVFWDLFREKYGPRADTDQALFEEFYATEFAKARTCCGYNSGAAEVIEALKEKGVRVVLATNPLFPRIATMQRIRWAGLDPADFELVTTYEDSHYCKPNPDYYREVLKRVGKRPDECLMVGNDAREDTVPETLGMKVFLLTDCLLHGEGADLSRWPAGGFEELKAFLAENL